MKPFLTSTLFVLLFLVACENSQPILGDVHHHANFKVFILGEELDFTQEKYMSTEDHLFSNFTHLHDGEGGVIHKHMSGITLYDFFDSLRFALTDDCLTLDIGETYCTDDSYTLTMKVNGKKIRHPADYAFEDLDRILISYYSSETNALENVLEAQMASVGDNACIYSETCPERGSPPDESSCFTSDDCVAEPQ